MFVLGRDFAKFNTNFEVMGGYISPVSDFYKKAGLAESVHRYWLFTSSLDYAKENQTPNV